MRVHLLALVLITSVTGLSQTPTRTTTIARAEQQLISLSQKAVDGVGTAKVVNDDRFTGSTSVVLENDRGKLLHPKVTITGDRALVTGRFFFEGGTKSSETLEPEPVKISFVKRHEQWRVVGLCWGTCLN